jgi:PAS domain-containing protein
MTLCYGLGVGGTAGGEVIEGEASFRALLESLRVPVLALDAGGRILYATPSAEALLGAAPL